MGENYYCEAFPHDAVYAWIGKVDKVIYNKPLPIIPSADLIDGQIARALAEYASDPL